MVGVGLSIGVFLHHLWQAVLHRRMVRTLVEIVPMILIVAMVKLGSLAAGRTMHSLHLVLISPLLTCNTGRDWRSRADAVALSFLC